jgi:hypothetical protein
MSAPESISARRAAVDGAVGFSLGWLLGLLCQFALPSGPLPLLGFAMPGVVGCIALSKWIPGKRTRAKAVVGFSIGFVLGSLFVFVPTFFAYWIFAGGRGGIVGGILCAVVLFVLAPGAWFGFAGFLGGIPLEEIQGGATLRMAKSFLVGGSIGGPFLVPGFLGWGTDPVANAFFAALAGIVPFAISGALFGRALVRGSQSAGGAHSSA